MNLKKYLPIIAGVLVVLNLGRMIYSDHKNSQPQKDMEAFFDKYFTDDDERMKMTWFSAQGNTIAIALEVKGLGRSPKNLEMVKVNSKRFVHSKVCNSAPLRDFINSGKYISVDIRNGDASNNNSVSNIMNVMMSANKCI